MYLKTPRLGSLGSAALRYPDTKGQVCQNFRKNYQVPLID